MTIKEFWQLVTGILGTAVFAALVLIAIVYVSGPDDTPLGTPPESRSLF